MKLNTLILSAIVALFGASAFAQEGGAAAPSAPAKHEEAMKPADAKEGKKEKKEKKGKKAKKAAEGDAAAPTK